MRNYIILFAWLLGFGAIAQTAPGIEWQHSYGSTHDDHAWSVQQTNDGGYIMAGDVRGNSGNVSGYHGGDFDAWVVKLDAQGNLDWQRSLGGSGSEGAQSIIQSSDGGYLITGGTNSTDGDIGVNHGGWDAWVVKLDSEGNITWARTYGGSNDDGARSICQTNDGGYVISGDSRSIDGEVTGNHGGPDCWVVKLNEVGELQWQKSLGGSGYDASYSIKQANDGGYILAGETSSNDGDVSGNHGGDGIDWWVVKLDGDGIMEWQKTLGGTGNDVASSVQQINDGSYIVVGEVDSDDGDVTGYHGGGDFWAVKLDSIGEIQWQQCYGGSSLDRAEGIQEVADDRFIIAGYTRSEDGHVTNYHGGQFGDAWLIRISNTGDLIWEKTMGGSGTDKAFAIEKSLGAGYIVAGY